MQRSEKIRKPVQFWLPSHQQLWYSCIVPPEHLVPAGTKTIIYWTKNTAKTCYRTETGEARLHLNIRISNLEQLCFDVEKNHERIPFYSRIYHLCLHPHDNQPCGSDPEPTRRQQKFKFHDFIPLVKIEHCTSVSSTFKAASATETTLCDMWMPCIFGFIVSWYPRTVRKTRDDQHCLIWTILIKPS